MYTIKEGKEADAKFDSAFSEFGCLMSLFEALMALFMKRSLRARDPSKRSRIYIHM